MLRVTLLAKPDVSTPKLMSDGARSCYDPEQPTDGKIIDLEHRIFDVGHHSVVQHPNFTFFIEGIAIGDITLGLHYYHPFYTSGQRSGRFCFGMFSDPNTLAGVEGYILDLYVSTQPEIKGILSYVKMGIELFNSHLDEATKVATDFIRKERPKATKKYIKQNAKKFAQEQLRMFVPVILPTAVQFTVNIYTVAAMYRTAWNPAMMMVTQLMADEILKLYPELGYLFSRQTVPECYHMPAPSEPTELKYAPLTQLLLMDDLSTATWPDPEEMSPFDTLQYDPYFMANNTLDILTNVEISLATMGQDQRHRTIKRGQCRFTGGIYCSPIIRELNLDHALKKVVQGWLNLAEAVPPYLLPSLAPYGAMVSYDKRGNLNAVLHEQIKRLCWCTQEEIYNLSRQLREQVSQTPECRDELLATLAPPCYNCGKCGEGKRYCGRNLAIDHDDFFPQRKV